MRAAAGAVVLGVAITIVLSFPGCGGFTGTEVDASATRPEDDATIARRDPISAPSDGSTADAGLGPFQSFPSNEETKLRIACGENGEACAKNGEVCCGGETWESSACEPACPRPLSLACDDPTDCARGSVCCGKPFAQRREVESSVCRPGACAKDEMALCTRHEQCASGTCAMARPQFLSRCE